MNNLEDYGWLPSMMPEGAAGLPARVTAVHRERYELACGYGTVYGRLKTAVYYDKGEELFPTVGDFVLLQYERGGDSLITKTLPRKSFFSRRDPNPKLLIEQAVAANFDICFIITSLNHDFNLSRLERYISIAWQSGAIPIVLLSKADLLEDYSMQIAAVENIAAGVDVIAVSTVSGAGLKRVKEFLKPRKTAVFLGSSGVGKSSLVNALSDESIMAVNAIREDDSRGRHTTTHRQLIMLQGGAMIIDTPGMRELQIWNGDGITETFADIETIISRGCKFSDCKHKTEPDCAVRSALNSGELPLKRWQNYLKLLREARYVENKAKFLNMKQEKNKTNAKNYRQVKKQNDREEY